MSKGDESTPVHVVPTLARTPHPRPTKNWRTTFSLPPPLYDVEAFRSLQMYPIPPTAARYRAWKQITNGFVSRARLRFGQVQRAHAARHQDEPERTAIRILCRMPEHAGSLRVFLHLNVNRAAPSSCRKGRGEGRIARRGSRLYRGRGDARGDRVLDRDRDRSTIGAAGGVA